MARIIIDELGCKWYHNSDEQPHREGGPAIIYPTCHKFWKIDGITYNQNGPSMFYPDGEYRWTNPKGWHSVEGRPQRDNPNGFKRWQIMVWEIDGMDMYRWPKL